MSAADLLLKELHEKISPRGFEKLCERLLEKMGFDEIEHTGGAGDYGIDLKAILRKSEIENLETNTPFCIQAKRYTPEKVLDPSVIRELRGSLKSGERGLLITTARVSDHSIENEALRDISRIILVIDGEKLIELLMKYGLGLVSKFIIDDVLLQSLESSEDEPEQVDSDSIVSKKLVTENDIRARIIRIPGDIKAKLPGNQFQINLNIDGNSAAFNIDQTRTFISGVTELFRINQMLDEDGTLHPKHAIWTYDGGVFGLGFENLDEDNQTKDLFKAALDTTFPGAKRLRNTSTYDIGGKRHVIKYSKVHKDGKRFWFGLMEPDIIGIFSGEIESAYLLCVGRGFLILEKAFLAKIKDKLNVSNKVPSKMLHFHIDWFPNGVIQLVLKDGDRLALDQTLQFIHSESN